jgi:hypothetical protein
MRRRSAGEAFESALREVMAEDLLEAETDILEAIGDEDPDRLVDACRCLSAALRGYDLVEETQGFDIVVPESEHLWAELEDLAYELGEYLQEGDGVPDPEVVGDLLQAIFACEEPDWGTDAA